MHITKIDMTCTTCFTKIKLWTTIQLKKILFCSYWCELLKTRVTTVDHPPPPPPLQQGSRTWKVSLGIWITIVWFQKISIPPPQKIIGNSEGEGGFKGSNFRGVWGFMGNYFPRGDRPCTKHWKQCTIDLKHKNIPMYVVLKQKSVLLVIDMRLTSLALMFLFFFELASATISRRTMCLWNEVENDWKWGTRR